MNKSAKPTTSENIPNKNINRRTCAKQKIGPKKNPGASRFFTVGDIL